MGDAILRADFRAFYEIEESQGQPLEAALGTLVAGGLTGIYDLSWYLAATWRRKRRDLTLDDFLDLLPLDPGELGALCFALIDEAVTPVCPVDESTEKPRKPERIRWTQFLWEATRLLRQSQSVFWRSTFRVHGALLWEEARYNDPEGKSGRPMAQWEIDRANAAAAAKLFAMGGISGFEAVRSS